MKKLINMEYTELNNKLKNRILEFRRQSTYIKNPFIFDINAVEIALCLSELGFYSNREITKEEEIWYLGHRHISDSIGSLEDWDDIYELYYDLVVFVNDKNFFRSSHNFR